MWMYTKMPAGPPKNKQISTVTVSIMYLKGKLRHPVQNSIKGQFYLAYKGSSSGLQSFDNMTMLEITIKMRINISEKMNTRYGLWLWMPTQLLIHGQWWSNLSTHLLHVAQCLDLGALITSQSGHISAGCTFSSKFMNGNSGLKYPGSLLLAMKNAIAKTTESIVIA